MATQKQRLDRYLRDFPWLWAMKTTWYETEDSIKVTLLSPQTDELDIDAGRVEVWVYGCGVRSSDEETWIREGRYSLVKVIYYGSDTRIGALAYHVASINFSAGTEHIALCNRSRNGGNDGAREFLDVQIFRAPAGVSLWALLQKCERFDKEARNGN